MDDGIPKDGTPLLNIIILFHNAQTHTQHTRATQTWREPETRPQKQSRPTDQPVKSIVQEIVIPRRRKGYTYHTILFLSSNFNRPLHRVLSDEPPPPNTRWVVVRVPTLHTFDHGSTRVCVCVPVCVQERILPHPSVERIHFFLKTSSSNRHRMDEHTHKGGYTHTHTHTESSHNGNRSTFFIQTIMTPIFCKDDCRLHYGPPHYP